MEFDFDLENPLANSNDNFTLLFHIETDHMPSKAYLQTLVSPHSAHSTRRQIVSLIHHFSGNFDPFSSYLAINYMDRFLSVHSIMDGKPWISKLVAISCISLALKMRKTEFSVSDFWHEAGVILDSVTVGRMEMLILATLKWRMRSISPFSFFSFFLSFFQLEDPKSTQELKDLTTHIIFKAQNDVNLLEFKPSIMAAAALLSAARQLFPVQLPSFRHSISSCEYVNKENLSNCCNTMQQSAATDGYDSISQMASNSRTPSNVLDVQCFSSSTSGNKQMRETRVWRNGEIRAPKRLKFEDFVTDEWSVHGK